MDVCSSGKTDLGKASVIQHRIRLIDDTPIHQKQFRIPHEHAEFVKKYVEKLVQQGVVEPSISPYNAPVFGVPKKPLPDGQIPDGLHLRVVLDYRFLNAASMDDNYVLRDVRECLDEIGIQGSTIFKALDMTSGFWQQTIDEASRPFTAFTVPRVGARYQWTRTPMGLKGSPSSFSKLMRR